MDSPAKSALANRSVPVGAAAALAGADVGAGALAGAEVGAGALTGAVVAAGLGGVVGAAAAGVLLAGAGLGPQARIADRLAAPRTVPPTRHNIARRLHSWV
jgi:hypothetical protein